MIKPILFLLFGMVLCIEYAHSQNQKVIDSLVSVLTDKTGGERYPPLYELAFEYIDRDNNKALTIIEQG